MYGWRTRIREQPTVQRHRWSCIHLYAITQEAKSQRTRGSDVESKVETPKGWSGCRYRRDKERTIQACRRHLLQRRAIRHQEGSWSIDDRHLFTKICDLSKRDTRFTDRTCRVHGRQRFYPKAKKKPKRSRKIRKGHSYHIRWRSRIRGALCDRPGQDR